MALSNRIVTKINGEGGDRPEIEWLLFIYFSIDMMYFRDNPLVKEGYSSYSTSVFIIFPISSNIPLCSFPHASIKRIIGTSDARITFVAGGYPLFVNGEIVGAIGVGGGTEAQDCEIAEHVVKVFEEFFSSYSLEENI